MRELLQKQAAAGVVVGTRAGVVGEEKNDLIQSLLHEHQKKPWFGCARRHDRALTNKTQMQF